MNRIVILLLALAFAAPASAELFRWTDAQGRVHYSDQPPPPNIKQMKRIATPSANTGTDTGRVRPPVVLYNANCGATCDQAADYLRQRGVPFSLKSADKDKAAGAELKKRTGSMEVPVLFIGESMQRGYSPSVWDKMLDVAGYAGPAKQPVEETEEAPKN
jgi:glutaredoxin